MTRRLPTCAALVVTAFVLMQAHALGAPPLPPVYSDIVPQHLRAHLATLKPVTAGALDLALMRRLKLQARAVDAALIAAIKPPAKLDYSEFITFNRCQAPWGGCIGHSMCHIMDILNEWEHPYTPDASFMYLHWQYGQMVAAHSAAGHTWDEAGDLGTPVLEHGLCSEARYHSDYDAATPYLSPTDTEMCAQGDAIYWLPGPSAEAQAEASLYRIKFSAPIAIRPGSPSPEVETLKRLLVKYGPILACGYGHATTIVGFDDALRRFKNLDNYGNWSHEGGFTYIPYDELPKHKETLQYPQDVPSERPGTQYAYTARIGIQHPWRGSLNVIIGVEGQAPMTVWTTRGRRLDRRQEWSSNLVLDVPLPAYAAQHWPPSAAHRWYVRVEDCDRDGWQGSLREFTLHRRYVAPNCLTVGAVQTETHGLTTNLPIPDPATGPVVAYDPEADRAAANPDPGVAVQRVPDSVPAGPPPIAVQMPVTYQVVLNADKSQLKPDGKAHLAGQVTRRVLQGQQPIPEPNATVHVYKLQRSENVHRPDTWMELGTAKTGGDGWFTYEHKQTYYETYAAAILAGDGTVLASSGAAMTSAGIPGMKVFIPTKPMFRWEPVLQRPRLPRERLNIPLRR